MKYFEEFIKRGVVKKQSPDKSRAEFLLQESENNYQLLKEMLKKIELKDQTANLFIKSCYDILMEVIRAKMLLEGYNASGAGAHEAEVSYLRKLSFSEKDVRFMNDLRYFRNGILYYGKSFDKEYGRKVLDFLKKTYPKLKERVIKSKTTKLIKDINKLYYLSLLNFSVLKKYYLLM